MASHVEGSVVPILCPKIIPKGNVEDFFFFFGFNVEEEFKY